MRGKVRSGCCLEREFVCTYDQSCPTLCDPVDSSLPSSSVCGNFQTRKFMYLSVFTEALFTTARTWKKPRCPSMDEEIKKLWYMCAIEYFPARKRKAYESVLMGWMDLQPII